MIKDLRTKAGIKEAESRLQSEEAARKRALARFKKAQEKFNLVWSSMEKLPFAAFEYKTLLVTDGESVAVVTIHKRFGRPIKVTKPAELAITDSGLAWVGGEYEEYDHPDWWFEWEFKDQLSYESEMYGKDQIAFVPTHWMPLPNPPKT